MKENGKGPGPDSGRGTPFKGIVSGEPRDPAGFLLKALGVQDPRQKRSFAEQGLHALDREAEDHEMYGLLLRQIYLADIEEGHDEDALHIASELIDLGTLGEVARQDAARAALGAHDISAAIGHLRIAARVCPPGRRAFHYGHLGALLRFAGQAEQAEDAFAKALKWATEHRKLYEAQKALAQAQAGKAVTGLIELRDALEDDEKLPVYALWILGELCLLLGENDQGREYLEQFLARQVGISRAKSLALQGEIAHATALLERLSA